MRSITENFKWKANGLWFFKFPNWVNLRLEGKINEIKSDIYEVSLDASNFYFLIKSEKYFKCRKY